MSRYLSALKISENVAGANLKNLKNPLEVSSLGFLVSPPPPFEINQAANDGTEQAGNVACFAWLIHFADRNPLEVTFSPMVNHAEALACYAEAIAAEPIKAGLVSPAPMTADDERAILAWLELSGETEPATIDEVLRQCRSDAETLGYFVGRAALSADPIADNRRTCRQCANLNYGGVCNVATPGGRVSAIRGYRPAPDLLQRCDAFNERTI